MMGYDAWLEAPYTRRGDDEAAFEAFCEREDVDPDEADAWDRFEAWVEDQREAAEEEAAEARAEAALEDW